MRVLKWDVPVDDRVHTIGSGPVVLVECQHRVGVVQVWTLEGDEGFEREVQAYGTGQPVLDGAVHLGSTIPRGAGGLLVWHLFDITGLTA